ncbi:HVO_2523 family zinc finger protein [Haloglomus litoreum]
MEVPGRRSEGMSGPPTCPMCETDLYRRHCKYVCPQHGPIIDCSDPFR